MGAIGRHIGEACLPSGSGVARRRFRTADHDLSGPGAADAGDAFDEFVLTVALHAGETDDLARPDIEREIIDRNDAAIADDAEMANVQGGPFRRAEPGFWTTRRSTVRPTIWLAILSAVSEMFS